MRIRQVRQDFWNDELVAGLPDPVRLFYIGLWCVADDAGWMRWDVPRIAALLYPFRPRRQRERQVIAWAGQLEEAGRVRRLDCGCAVIPTLTKHQVIGGKKAEPEKKRHYAEHLGTDSPGSPGIPLVTVGNGRVGNGSADARDPGGAASAFDELMAAAGVKPELAS